MAGTPGTFSSAELLEDLNIRHERDVPMGPLTWYGVGGRAAVLAHPSGAAQLGELVKRCREQSVPIYVLGSGANLLVTEAGVPGVVVQLNDESFCHLRTEGNIVTAGAGYDLFKLVTHTARAGLAGLEVVAGIPASVGGAVRMNAGGAYGDIGSSVLRIRVMSENGQVYYRERDDLVFGYRQTNIAAPFILEVDFELTEEEPEALMRRVKEIFFYKKSTQPMAARSAGCAFKNPPDEVAATAGQLIDRAGLKGYTIGAARVSDVHANFVIADRNSAKADDIRAVIDHVHDTVLTRFGVDLEREVVVWP